MKRSSFIRPMDTECKEPRDLISTLSQGRAAQGISTYQGVSKLRNLAWKIMQSFESYSEQANSHLPKDSFFLQENRVKIRVWQINNKIFHPNNLGLSPPSKPYEDQTNDLMKEVRHLKLLCKQATEAFAELNAAVKAGHPNTKRLNLNFHSVLESVQQMDQALSN